MSFQSSVRVGGAFTFTLSLVDVGIGFAGVASAVLHVLLWVWVAGPPRVDVTNIFIKAVGVAGMSLTYNNHERQSAALLQVPDIHLNLILQVASSKDHLFTLLLAFFPFRNFCRGLWSLQKTMSDPCR